jgi:hypothetical protein
MNDDLAGEIPVAFIVRTEGSQVTEDEIKQFVAKEVKAISTLLMFPQKQVLFLRFEGLRPQGCNTKGTTN